MLEFLHRLFIGHIHSWEILEICNVQHNGIKYGRLFILKYKQCGKLKNKQLNAK